MCVCGGANRHPWLYWTVSTHSKSLAAVFPGAQAPVGVRFNLGTGVGGGITTPFQNGGARGRVVGGLVYAATEHAGKVFGKQLNGDGTYALGVYRSSSPPPTPRMCSLCRESLHDWGVLSFF